MLNEVIFTNTRGTVPLTMQKLDQDGANAFVGAVFELKTAAGDPVYAMKDTDSSGTIYTVPSSGANQIVSGAAYYIVLKADETYAIEQDASAASFDAKLQKKSDSTM